MIISQLFTIVSIEVVAAYTLNMAPRPRTIFRRDAVDLPANLLQTIPTCAQDCVSTAINSSFVPSKCDRASDAGCLCSHYSTQGYALGELALGCLYSNCPESTREESSRDVFNLCSTYSSAVSATHSVLTLTTMGAAPSTSLVTTSTSAVHTTQTVQTDLSSANLTSSSRQTIIVTSTASANIIRGSSSTSVTSTATSTQSPKGLTTGQAVGVSVASIAIAGLLVGLIFFCCCCVRRRRKEKAETPTKKSIKSRHSSFDFVDKSPPDSPSRAPIRPPARPQQEWWRNTGPFHPEMNHASESPRSQRASFVPSLQALRQASNDDNANHTERPQRKSFKIPAPAFNMNRASRRFRPNSAATGWTVFEEDCKSPLPKRPTLPKPVILPPISPSPGPSFADNYTMSPEDMAKPGLSLQIPGKALKHDELPVPNHLASSPGMSKSIHISMPPSSAASYIPAYYTSNDSRTPVAPRWSPQRDTRFSQPQLIPKPLMSRGVRSSWASATTFESVDPDETTPENEDDKQLSPVCYPKVPRPSNQAIPRSPPSVTSPRFGSSVKRQPTLFAKRRGEDLSLDLGRGLRITNATSNGGIGGTEDAHQSPLKGYGKGVKRSSTMAKGETPEMGLKSPLWEPKLTPSRRGDDLFLSVEPRGR